MNREERPVIAIKAVIAIRPAVASKLVTAERAMLKAAA
jgi:hypothetical protein